MRDALDKLVETEIAESGATQASVRKALDRQAGRWERSLKSSKLSRDEIRERADLVGRAGRFLYYFHHGHLGGNSTAADEALLTRIKALPPK